MRVSCEVDSRNDDVDVCTFMISNGGEDIKNTDRGCLQTPRAHTETGQIRSWDGER